MTENSIHHLQRRFGLFGLKPCLLLCLLLSFSLFPGAGMAQKKSKGLSRPKPVVVAKVLEVTEAPTFSATGLLLPSRRTQISLEVPGRVTHIYKRAGAEVKEGEILARISNTSLSLQLETLKAKNAEAQAQLKMSKSNFKRVRRLYKRKMVSAEKYETEAAKLTIAQARSESGKAQLKRLKAQLEMMIVRAPFSGQVVKAGLEHGQWVAPGRMLYELYSFDHFELKVGLPGRYMGQVPSEASVKIEIPEIHQRLEGVILDVVRHVDAQSGNFSLRIGIPNPEGKALSGLLAKAKVPLGKGGKTLTINRDALMRKGKTNMVVAVRKGRAALVAVELGGELEKGIIITGTGLNAGDEVVIRGNESLREGMEVKVVETR